MSLDIDSENLYDDGFEGSTNEHRIFTEVFLGKNQGKASKKCLVTGAINFARDKSKPTDALFSQQSENSVISSQLNFSNSNCQKENSGPRDDNDKNGKHIKLSVDDQSVFNSVTCRLAESTTQGIISSSFLLKGNISMHTLPSFHENNEEKVSANKAIPSPVSQESHATKSPSPRTHGEKVNKSKVDNNSGNKVVPQKDSTKDPRPVLRSYIQNLLRATGWEIEKRKRTDKANGGYIYKTPNMKKQIREFHRAWNSCAQGLSIDETLLVLEEGKQWNNMTSFWSDLSLTLNKIDEESSPVQQWCLLDPFANLVFIEKKLGLLQEGKVVEARYSLVMDSHGNEGAVGSLKNKNKNMNKSKKDFSHGLCESSLVGGSVLTNIEANNSVSRDSCGTRITVDIVQFNNRTVNGTSDGLNSNALQVSGIEGNSDNSSSCLNEIPVTPQNKLVALSESFFPPQEESAYSRVRNGFSKRGVRNGSAKPELVKGNNNIKTHAQSGKKRKRSDDCDLEDGDLLISSIRKKTSESSAKKSARKTKPSKLKPMRKRKTQKGGCRLLRRSLSKGGKNERKWYIYGPRTVLSWLIYCGTISLKEVIHYRDSEDNAVVKEGSITKDGILCTCCNKIFSVSQFKTHAGFSPNNPCLNLVMGSGKPFTLCQIEAWSGEYKTRKNATRPVEVEDLDQNDDSCGLCGDGGELICCENCPSTFHQKCLCEQEFPEGDWYCPYCTCRICSDLVNDKEASISTTALKCLQCEHKYHEACLKEKVVSQEVASEAWFCGENCQEVYLGLQSQVGVLNYMPDGFSWTLLRCIHGDQKVHSAQNFVDLRAECNLKLAVALTIMEECFLSMVDARTGIDMIPHVLYNWGSEFARLNYHGFYTMVLEKDDVLISAASIRIHGVTVAEMPLIATCSKYRRQGMCRRLMDSIEQMLKSFKVEKLVITAIPDVVETWTVGFGFEPLEDYERKSLSHINLMVFPGTVWLKKTMFNNQATNEQTSFGHAAPCWKDNEAETKLCSDGGAISIDSPRTSNKSLSLEVVNVIENGHTDVDVQIKRDNSSEEDFSKMSCDELNLMEGKSLLQMLGEGGSAGLYYEREFSKVSYGEEPTSVLGGLQLETASNVDSVAMDDARNFSKLPYEAQPILDQGECQS